HAADEGVPVGQVQEPVALGHGHLGLDGDAAVIATAFQQGLEIRGEEVALEDGHRVIDPAVGLWGVAPEVLVSIEPSHGAQDTLCRCSGPSWSATCTVAPTSSRTS